MWRREEELGYWLSDSHSSEKPDLAYKLKSKLPHKLALWQFRDIVKEQSLCIGSKVISLDEELAASAGICDGLGAIGQWICSDAVPAIDGPQSAIHHAELIDHATVRDLKMPDEQQARIRHAKVNLMTQARSLPVKLDSGGVQSLACFKGRSAEVLNGERFLMASPGIGAQMSGISAIPHMRQSLDVNKLPDEECLSFLREAEALRRIPSGKGELIAVFRHVPIEAISRLQFLSEKRIILFSVSSTPRRTKTRVHDMAAIRNMENQEIHLVAHRTRCRLVSFN